MIGTKLGRYEILAKLGAGGMGEVYRARDLSLGREVALKILPDQVRDDKDRLRRFEQEARAASALNHPNIVVIYDIRQADGVPYIAMELIEGHTLRGLLGRRPAVDKRALGLAAQAAEGLARAHGIGIVHRDLKPENLMVTRDGFVKILDFGLAKLHEPDPALASDAPTEAGTRPGVLLGTVGYMSPEQARGRTIDFRSDQFAFGAILYELATGRRAFERESPVQTLAAIIESEPEPIQALNPDVPPPFRWIVERCLKKAPDERYASTLDLARELRNVHERLEEVASGSGSAPRPQPPPPGWRATWGRRAGLAALLAAALGLGLWLRPPPAAPERPQAAAVLPVLNLGGRPEDDYLGIAIADAVTTALAGVPGLSVVDRSALREAAGRDLDPGRAARDVGAAYAVTGGFQRAGSLLNVTVKLVAAADSSVRWAEQYQGSADDLFALQQRIGAGLRGALEPGRRAGGAAVARPPTRNSDAYADYLQARAFLERPDVPANVDRAITLFGRAVQKDASFSLAHAGLGEAYWEKYKATKDAAWTAQSREAILEALRLEPDQPQVRISLALVYQNVGRLDAAAEELRRAIAQQPGNDDAHRTLGEILAAQGSADDALLELRRAVELRPNYWRNHFALATHYVRKARYPEAIAAARRVTELQPDNSRGFQVLGFAHQMADDAEAAIRAYQQALALAPDARAYTNLGKIYYDRGSYADAVDAWEKAVALEPTPIKHRNLGDAYRRLGQEPAARQAYQRALALGQSLLRVNPGDFRELSTLAVVEAKLGRAAEARRHMEGALALNRSDGETLYRAAVVHALAGRQEQALGELAAAVAAGFSRAHARADEDLAPLRGHPQYRSLVGERP